MQSQNSMTDAANTPITHFANVRQRHSHQDNPTDVDWNDSSKRHYKKHVTVQRRSPQRFHAPMARHSLTPSNARP